MPDTPFDLSDPCCRQGIEDEINGIYTPPLHYDDAQRQNWSNGQVYSSFYNLARIHNPCLIDQPIS